MPPDATNNAPIPKIDHKFLERILQERENDYKLRVIDFKISKASGKYGYLSNMIRIEIDVQRNKSKNSEIINLIMKVLPSDESAKDFISGSTAFPTEMKMFSSILPKIHHLLSGVGKSTKIAAKYYYHKETKPFALIVEDLSAKGFRLADRTKGLDLEHCKLVVRNMGMMHAATLILHEEMPADIENLNGNFFSEDFTDGFYGKVFYKSLKAMATVVDDMLPNNDNYADRLMKCAKTIRKDHKKSYAPTEGGFNVLIHGDLWTNNLLFRYDELSNKVEEVKFVDFQLSCYSPAVVDLHYFLTTSADEDVRLNHSRALLREYYNELRETLLLLDYKHPVVSFDQILEEYESKETFRFIVFILILPIVAADAKDDINIGHLADDLNDIEGFLKRIQNPFYTKIMKRMLPHFANKGIF